MRVRVVIYFIVSMVVFLRAAAQPDERARYKALRDSVEISYDNHSPTIQHYVDEALPLAAKLRDTSGTIRMRRLLGLNYFLIGHSDDAIKVLLDEVRMVADYPPGSESAELYYAVAQVYGMNKYPVICRQYLEKGVEIARKIRNESVIADGYNRLGIWFERTKMLDSALYFYKQALYYTERSGVVLGKAYCFENIAGIYAQKNQLSLALSYMQQALVYKKQAGKKMDVAISYINIGEAFDSLKQYDSAILYANAAIELSREVNYKDLIKYGYHFLSRVYETRGDNKRALMYHKLFSELNDTIFNETKAQQLAELNAKYQAGKKEEEIRELNSKATIQGLQLKHRNTLLIVAFFVFVAGSVIVYLIYNRRKLKEQTELQAEINRQQAITTREVLYAEDRERKRIAADLHDGVGQLMSATLLNLNSFLARLNVNTQADPQADRILSLVTESYDELRSISHQMMPGALLRSGLDTAVRELVSHIDPEKIEVFVESEGLEERLSEETETVLYRVIQESVNNVIKHANATRLNLQLVRDEDGVSVTIEDNGNGFDRKQASTAGIGLKNIYSRVLLQNGTVDIDSHPGKGTLVAIHIPL